MIESQFKTVLNYINLGARPAFILYLLHIIFPFILWVVVVAVAPHSYWIFFWFLPLSSFCLIIARAMIINLSPQGRKYQEQDFSIISNAARCTDVTFSSSVHPCLKKIPTKNLKDIFPIFWRSNLHFVEVKSIAILVKFCWLSRCPVATLVIFLSSLYCKAPTASQERRRQFKETAKVVTPPPL